MALVRDPYFWKRFSTAVHLEEVSKAELQETKPAIEEESWLARERGKRRRSMLWGLIICLFALCLVVAAVIVWWLGKHNWLRDTPVKTPQTQ